MVCRVFEEGEADLESSGEEDFSEVENEDEWSFLLDEALKLSQFTRDGQTIITWIDPSGDIGDRFEFLCESGTGTKLLNRFDLVSRRGQYERKYNKAFSGKMSDLDEFNSDDLVNKLVVGQTIDKKRMSPKLDRPLSATTSTKSTIPAKTPFDRYRPASSSKMATVPVEVVEGRNLVVESVSVYLFDSVTQTFVEQEATAEVSIIDIASAKFEYFLDVVTAKKRIVGRYLTDDISEKFNPENLAFVFNHHSERGSFTFLLKFYNESDLDKFRRAFAVAMWQHNNHMEYTFDNDSWDLDYFADLMSDLSLQSASDDDDEQDENDLIEEGEQERNLSSAGGQRGYDKDEEFEESADEYGQGKNSQLAVGMANDRSYVVRGNQIGVFKSTSDNDLEYSTTISGVKGLDGRSFVPSNVMLHTRDRGMLMQNPEDLSKVYKMDLERGVVVEEWTAGANSQIKSYGPKDKFAQTTDEQSVVGLSSKSMFLLDPRVSGSDKLVTANKFDYATNVKLSSLATTKEGQIAVGSESGEIRLFDRLGIRAKSLLPALERGVLGLDTSSDGRWLLATYRHYLLLIDTLIKDGVNEGELGYKKSFSKNSKPRPRRLQISPEHMVYMQTELGKMLEFTPAHFNAGIDAKEQTIVSSAGPFVISWTLRKILRNEKDPYLIKRYKSEVTADNFQFGTDKRVIVALEDDVGIVSRSTFRKPTVDTMLGRPSRNTK